MLAPNLSNQAHLGVLLADYAGLLGIEAVTIEAAGASGGAALRQGYLAVASGMVDVALVVGVEKFTDKVGPDVDTALATTSDSDFEAVQGMTPTAQAALLMKRYMHEYNVPSDGFAGFALTAHANGVGNPCAMFRKAIKPETYAKAEMVSDPLNMFDMAPNADGAAALVLTRRDLLPPNYSHPLVKIAGSAASSDTLALHDRKDMLYFRHRPNLRRQSHEAGWRCYWMISIFSNITMCSASTPHCNSKRLGLPSEARAWKLAAGWRDQPERTKSPAPRWAA